MESVNLDKSINEASVSSISTDWSIQSISIKSDLLIFIDWLIDKSMPIFIDWLLRVLLQSLYFFSLPPSRAIIHDAHPLGKFENQDGRH